MVKRVVNPLRPGWRPEEIDALTTHVARYGTDAASIRAAAEGLKRPFHGVRMKVTDLIRVGVLSRVGVAAVAITDRLAESDPSSTMALPAPSAPPVPEAPMPALPAKPDPTNAEIMRLEQANVDLTQQLRDAQAKLKVAYKEQSVYERLATVIQHETAPLPALKIPAPKMRKSATPVDGVLLLSDEHADQVITAAGTWGMEQYDFNIFRCRLTRLYELIVAYVSEHLPAHTFERLWVFKLGDGVHGDGHGSKPRNHFRNTLKAALALGDAEAQFVQQLVPHFRFGVHTIAVSGNHPRNSGPKKDYVGGPHDNFDYLVAHQMATRLSEEIRLGRVTVHAPEAWTAYVDVRGHLWALNHGDDVVGYAGHPWYGFERKNSKVQSLVARKGRRVRYFAYGHYHTSVEYQSAGGESLHASNWSLTDQYALEKLSAGSEPSQPLYVVNEDHGIVLKCPIYVRDEEREAKHLAGRWDPPFGRNLTLESVTPPARSGFQVIDAASLPDDRRDPAGDEQ